MNVVYQFNEKYAPYAAVSITSLLINNKNASIYVLGENLSPESVLRLSALANQNCARIVFSDTNKLVQIMKEMNMPTYRGSYAANMRLFLPYVLGEEVDRILYLDADTVINDDISNLYNTDMSGAAIGMVYDSLAQMHKYDIGLAKEDGYFNSGVILFNLKKWREFELTERIVDHVKHVRCQYAAPDQDLLNIVCKEYIYRLPISYNFQPQHGVYSAVQFLKAFKPEVYYSVDEMGQAPSIYHCYRFLGEFPWDKGNLHPFTEIFDKYLSASTYNDYIKEVKEQTLSIRIEKILYRLLPTCVFLPIFVFCHRLFMKKADNDSANNVINNVM